MLDNFRNPPAALTRRQTQIFAIASIFVAITRLLSRTRSPWDWDEYQFLLGIGEYDVTEHHPHPPGYPLFIALAKGLRLFVQSDFHALQLVVLFGALLLFPAVFLLARELRFDFETSLFGALIASFLPNLWYYGGTAFSDVPGLVSGLLACVLILRGCRDGRVYVAGAFLLGMSAGIRPQNLLTALVPALIATAIRIRVSWRSVLAGALAGAIAVGGCYAGAALASSSVRGYVTSIQWQQKWVHDRDSYHSPERDPLSKVAVLCFRWPSGARHASDGVSLLALISLLDAAIRRRFAPWLVLATFLPFAIFTWLMLSVEAISRYSIGYIVAMAILAADGIAVLAVIIRWRREAIQAVLSMTLAAMFAVRTYPLISTMHRTLSPVANAFRFVRLQARPRDSTIFVSGALSPQAAYELRGYDLVYFDRDEEVPIAGYRLPAFVVTADRGVLKEGTTFSIPRDRLKEVVRDRNFEVSVVPAYERVRFGEGWYDAEGEGSNRWRWMGRSATLVLSPIRGRGRLAMHFLIPISIEAQPPVLEVRVNGVLVEHSVCNGEDQRREWVLDSRRDAGNDVQITISEAPIPAAIHRGSDGRALGLELRDCTWTQAR